MSKILITGCNRNQTTENFYLKQQLKVVPSHYSLIKCLRDMGHEVEQRLVEVGEDISQYDRVIVFLASPRQLTSGFFYNGLYAISQRDDVILAFDDWQINDMQKGIEVCVDDKKLFNKFTLSLIGDKSLTEEVLEKNKDNFRRAIEIIRSKTCRVLLSTFKGGDLSKLIDYPLENVFTYNPNPYHLNRKPKNAIHHSEKKREFNFASLVQSKTKKWLKKQKINKWVVEFFGSKKENQRRLKEYEMCEVFCEQWGCLLPSYDNAGSGWWRARPLQVADAGSILIGGYDEMMLYYNDEYLANLKAHEIEDLHYDDLKIIADRQKEALHREHPLKKEVQQEELTLALNL